MGHNHRGGVDCFVGSTAAAIVPHAKEIARNVIYSELFLFFTSAIFNPDITLGRLTFEASFSFIAHTAVLVGVKLLRHNLLVRS